jgi:hypothetical protein
MEGLYNMAKKRQLLEREQMTPFVDFDNTPVVEGKVIDYRETTTKFGAGMVIDIVTKDGEKLSVMESAGLKGYKWQDMKDGGAELAIEPTGWDKGTNGRFRTFDVFLLS